jgi:hypothetical protein
MTMIPIRTVPDPRLLFAGLSEFPFDPVKASLHVACQFVHPEADNFPSGASQLSVAVVVIEFSVSVGILVPLPTIHFDVEVHSIT